MNLLRSFSRTRPTVDSNILSKLADIYRLSIISARTTVFQSRCARLIVSSASCAAVYVYRYMYTYKEVQSVYARGAVCSARSLLINMH